MSLNQSPNIKHLILGIVDLVLSTLNYFPSQKYSKVHWVNEAIFFLISAIWPSLNLCSIPKLMNFGLKSLPTKLTYSFESNCQWFGRVDVRGVCAVPC